MTVVGSDKAPAGNTRLPPSNSIVKGALTSSMTNISVRYGGGSSPVGLGLGAEGGAGAGAGGVGVDGGGVVVATSGSMQSRVWGHDVAADKRKEREIVNTCTSRKHSKAVCSTGQDKHSRFNGSG